MFLIGEDSKTVLLPFFQLNEAFFCGRYHSCNYYYHYDYYYL